MSSEVVVIDGQEYPEPPPGVKVLKNGAGYDMETKRIMAKPGTFGPGEPGITKANASELAARRHELARERINAAIVEQMQERGVNLLTAPDAVGHAAGVLWGRIYDDKYPLRDQRQVWLDISRAAGLLQDPRSADAPHPGGARIDISADAIAAILQATGRSGGGE